MQKEIGPKIKQALQEDAAKCVKIQLFGGSYGAASTSVTLAGDEGQHVYEGKGR